MLPMNDFAAMPFDQARDNLCHDFAPSMAHTATLMRTMSAPTMQRSRRTRPSMALEGGMPFPLLMLGGHLPTMVPGGMNLSRDELQTLLLHESEPHWTPASSQDIRDLQTVTIQQHHLHNADTKTCSVCQDDFKLRENATMLTCSHLFHEGCIKPWLAQNRTCPLCRKEVVNVRAEQTVQQVRGQRQQADNVSQASRYLDAPSHQTQGPRYYVQSSNHGPSYAAGAHGEPRMPYRSAGGYGPSSSSRYVSDYHHATSAYSQAMPGPEPALYRTNSYPSHVPRYRTMY